MYYRYNIDFISVIISLGAIGVAFVCIMLKVIRLLFELAFNKFFITLLAFADISDGKRLKEMVKHIIYIFIVIFITAVLTNMYMLYNSWITRSLVANGLGNNGILKILFIVGGAIAVIDGPNLVERILGIDAGLKSSWGTLMAGYGVARGALNSGKLLAGLVPKLGNGFALGMAGVGGAMSGMFEGKDKNNIPNKENDSDIKKQDKTVDSQPSQMKASKDNEADLNTINDKFKDIDELKNNSANLNALNDKFREIDELRNNPNKDFGKNSLEDNDSKGLDGKTVQEGMKSFKNNESNLNSPGDKFKDIEGLRKNQNNDLDKNNIAASKTKGLDGQTVQEGIKAVKNNGSNLSSLNDKFKDIENLRNNPNKDFSTNNIEGNKINGSEGQTMQEGMKSFKNNASNLNASENKVKDIGDSRNSINKNNTDSVGSGNTTENINTKEIKSNTEDKTNVVSNNKGNESTNNKNNSENNNGGRKEVKGKMEDRTIGQYMKDKVQGSRFVDNINRAYSLGYNTTSKWDIKNKNKKGRKK